MPYVSPKGAISRSAPARSSPKPQYNDATSSSTPGSNVATTQLGTEAAGKRVYLVYDEDIRPMDPQVVHELEEWNGWRKEKESPADEEDVDPLVEAGINIPTASTN